MTARRERNELVDQHAPLAARLARRYRQSGEPLEDLVQVAYVGLILAADRYDPERGKSFTSFAVPTILGELRRHLRDHRWAARVPRGLQENVLRVTTLTDELTGELGRAPTQREVARATGLTVDDVIEAMHAASAYSAESLDRQAAGHDEEREPLVATIGGVDSRYEFIDNAVSLRPAVAELSPQEHTMLSMRFFEDLTQSQIADALGVSQMQVSRVLRGSVDKLHEMTAIAA